MATKNKPAPMKRRRRDTKKWEPRCFHCHTELGLDYGEWRAPFRDTETHEWLWGVGVVVCGPSCPELPEDEIVFRRRPPVESWRTLTPAQQDSLLAGYDL